MIRPFPKPHSFPRPNPVRLPERKRMTIAAGLTCQDGIVFGADTQETVGEMRGRVHKIPNLLEPYCTAIITGACEDGQLMDTAIERIFDKITETKPTSNNAIMGLLREVML